jgi:ferredoxin
MHDRSREVTIDPNTVPKIDTTRCTGCGRCIAACTEHVLTLEVFGFRKFAMVKEAQRCLRCFKCVTACPVGALVGSEQPDEAEAETQEIQKKLTD